jgi:hypothetical protein
MQDALRLGLVERSDRKSGMHKHEIPDDGIGHEREVDSALNPAKIDRPFVIEASAAADFDDAARNCQTQC